jgi:hypothetical protein
MSFGEKWDEIRPFNEKEFRRIKLLENRKEKLNNLNER